MKKVGKRQWLAGNAAGVVGLTPRRQQRRLQAAPPAPDQDLTLQTIVSSHLQDVQKYLSLTSHFFSAILFVANREMFEKLDPADQALLIAAPRYVFLDRLPMKDMVILRIGAPAPMRIRMKWRLHC